MRKLLSAIVFLLVGFTLTNRIAFTEDSRLWGGLKPGAHGVGFRSVFRYDYSRPYKRKYNHEGKLQAGERGRPIQISIWYPAKPGGSAASMAFEDYVHLTAKEESSGELTEQDKQQSATAFLKSRWSGEAPEDQLKAVLKIKTAAVGNAQPADGKFPVVLIAHSVSMSFPYGQSMLSEYLASHGYVVASVPSHGSASRQMSFDTLGVLSQMQDLQYVIQFLHDEPYVDRNGLAVIGFSFGALSTSLLSMHNTDVDAYISLDGSTGNRFGYSVLFQNPLYEPSKLTAPTLHVASQEPNPDANDTFFKALKYSNIHFVRFKGMRSGVDFSTFGVISSFVPKFGGAPLPDGSTAEERSAAHAMMSQYILNFLNGTVKRDPKALAFVQNEPQANGFPADKVQVEVKRGFKAPPTEPEFVKIIQEKGINEANRIYQEVSKNDPDYNLFQPESLNALGEELIQNKKTKEAIEVLKLNVEAFPDFWLVYDALGKAYMADGNKQMAIENFSRSLELNPENPETAETLKKLQES